MFLQDNAPFTRQPPDLGPSPSVYFKLKKNHVGTKYSSNLEVITSTNAYCKELEESDYSGLEFRSVLSEKRKIKAFFYHRLEIIHSIHVNSCNFAASWRLNTILYTLSHSKNQDIAVAALPLQ